MQTINKRNVSVSDYFSKILVETKFALFSQDLCGTVPNLKVMPVSL